MIDDLREHYLFLRRIERELNREPNSDEQLAQRLRDAQESVISLLDTVADMRDEIMSACVEAHKKALTPLLVKVLTRHK